MTEEVNGSIKYTAKELFEKIDGKLDAIDSKLDDKIGRGEFDELKTRVQKLEGQAIKVAAAASSLTAAAAVALNYFIQ